MFFLWLRQLPQCGNQTPAPVPPPAKGRWEKLLFPLLVPSSYWVLHGSIYSFPLVRYSCLLSAGVLHAVLCLKVYSWYILGENCTPHPPTPSPSCSLDPQHIVLPNWRQLHRLSKLQPVQQKMTVFLIHNQHPKQPYLWSQCGSGGWLCAKWLSSQNLASCSATGKGSHKTRSTVRQMPLLSTGWPPSVFFFLTQVSSQGIWKCTEFSTVVIKMDSFPIQQWPVSLLSEYLKTQSPSASVTVASTCTTSVSNLLLMDIHIALMFWLL